MPYNNGWPYTDVHQLNLDWIVDTVKDVKDKTDEIDQAVEEAKLSADSASENAQSASDSANAANLSLTQFRAESDALSHQVQINTNNIAIDSARIDAIISGTTPDANAELIDIRVGANGVTYATAGDAVREQVTDLQDEINDIETILQVIDVNPENLIDENNLTVGRILYNGTIDSNTSWRTTDYIPVSTNDVLRLFKGNSDGQGGYTLQRVTGERLALYDATKTYISVSGQYPFTVNNGYTVTDVNAKFIRASFADSITPVEMTKGNVIPAMYTPYVVPYKESQRLVDIENALNITTEKIVDCWGDSFTEMSIGTSYTDYLAGLLGNDYIVANLGLSGQSIGSVAFRFGSNEVYLTLSGNKIPASGSVNITDIACSKGSRTGNNMETADVTRGSYCTINGVLGMLVYQRNGEKKFIRNQAGNAVNVFPHTKAIPTPYFNEKHMQILWAGKNDIVYAWPDIVSGVTANYDAMVKKIPHDKFLILGTTYSNTSSYDPQSTNRGYVDSINTYLATNYPDNFIDIQSELVTNGLTLENITPTTQDYNDIANGFIPTSLMDGITHLNSYGREAVAKIVYSFMQSNDWI